MTTWSGRTRGRGFKLIESRFGLDFGNIFFTMRLVPEQVAQRNCGCTITVSVHVQAGWDFRQPSLVEGVPAQGRMLELWDC